MEELNFSQLFHQYTKRFHKPVPVDSDLWPDEWKTVFYKCYPRFNKIKLIHSKLNFNLFEAIKKRESRRDMSGSCLSLKEISIILEYGCGITRRAENGNGRRAYPSAGARYPLETYVLVIGEGDDNGIKKGLYHYDLLNHQLDILPAFFNEVNKIESLASYEFVQKSSILVFFSAVFERTQMKYGQRGYRFILQESGHIGQNIYLICEALGLKCCSLGGFRISDKEIEKLLDIDGVTESVVYAMAIGK
jgi:SagB-type dehydrogenase family enzyme